MAEPTACDKTWLRAYRYPDMDAAGIAYVKTRDIIFRHDIDASAYRILVADVPHIVVLGEGQIDPQAAQRLERACIHGIPSELPSEVQRQLVERRAEGKIPGVFWERRRL
jgi:hypothetical protein